MKDGQDRRYEFRFSKRQIALLFGGVGVMAMVLFALGLVVGKGMSEINTIIAASPVQEPVQTAPPSAPEQAAPEVVAADPLPVTPPPAEPPIGEEPPAKAMVPVPESAPTAFVSTLPEKPLSTEMPVQEAALPKTEKKPAPVIEATEKVSPPIPDSEPAPKPAKAPKKKARKPVKKEATKVASPQPKAKEPIPGGYQIQAGSFADRTDAEELARAMGKKGISASVLPVEVSGRGTWYRVRTEAYRTKDDAQREMNKLQQSMGLTPLLIAVD